MKLIKGRRRNWKDRLFHMTRISPSRRWVYPPEITHGWMPYQEFEWNLAGVGAFWDAMSEAFRKLGQAFIAAAVPAQELVDAMEKVKRAMRQNQ